MRVSFGFRQSVDKLQDACKSGGYVQEGRGGPAASSHTRPAMPTVMRCDASTNYCDERSDATTVS